MYPLEEVMKEDRMGGASIRSPQQDEVRFFDLLIAAGPTTGSKYGRQTDD